MAIASAAIRTAISELLEGSIGTLYPEAGTFERGAFDGQPDAAKLAKLRQTSHARHWFDVVLLPARQHPASNVSQLASRAILAMAVEIPVWTCLRTEAQADERASTLAAIASDSVTACRSLARPHGLDATADAVATGIVGGCVSSPNELGTGIPVVSKPDEQWDKRWVRWVIAGSIIIDDELDS